VEGALLSVYYIDSILADKQYVHAMSVSYSKILNAEEIEACRDAFLQFDADHSGTIDVWELKEVLVAMGQNPTEDEIINMISEVDDNDSNSIDFSEFLQVIARQKLESADLSKERDIVDAWTAVGGGADGEGIVNGTMLIKIIKNDFGLNIDIEKLLDEIDTSGDGEVDFEEFKALFA
jgi:Ca2+-binding EF-hand superfamily protein